MFFLKPKWYYPPSTGGLDDVFDDRDFEAREVFTYTPVEWKKKTPDQWRHFPIFSQNGSGSCVAQTVAKVLGIENWVEEKKFVMYSARDIYSLRKNKPQEGMYYRDGMSIGYKHGATVEQLMPSQGLTEEQMNDRSDATVLTDQIALPGKGGNYISLPFNFDSIAQVVARGKAVALGTRFNAGDFRTPVVRLHRDGQYGHAITIVDYTLWQGEKALVFDNSWGEKWGYDGQGVLRESQLSGIVAAWYFENLDNNWRDKIIIPKPKYTFNKDLLFGMNNNDVSMLQECLKYEELFPYNIPSTGYYGNITSKAVLAFQRKYKVASEEELTLLNGRRVGPKTREALNDLFA